MGLSASIVENTVLNEAGTWRAPWWHKDAYPSRSVCPACHAALILKVQLPNLHPGDTVQCPRCHETGIVEAIDDVRYLVMVPAGFEDVEKEFLRASGDKTYRAGERKGDIITPEADVAEQIAKVAEHDVDTAMAFLLRYEKVGNLCDRDRKLLSLAVLGKIKLSESVRGSMAYVADTTS